MSLIKKHNQLNSLKKLSVYSPLVDFKIPNFLNIQTDSFKNLLTTGLIEEFETFSQISNSDQSFEISFYATKYKVCPPKWTPSQAILKRKTYACQLYLPVRITDYKLKQTSFHWVKLANLPMMTKYGHFIINGSARIIMNQIVRSPGVYFQKAVKDKNIMIYSADFIAFRGAWLRIEVDNKNGEIWAKLKRTPKIPIILFLKCFGVDFPLLNNYLHLVHLNFITKAQKRLVSSDSVSSDEQNTLFLTKQQALTKLSELIYPTVKPSYENGQMFLFRKFLNSRTYNLSSLGRARLNQKLGICVPTDYHGLTGQDILFACLFLIDLAKGTEMADDIDDLQNRKIKPCGELIQNQLAIGLSRLEKSIIEQYKQIPYKKIILSNLLSASPINSSLRDFFGTNPLSQMMDQTNALAELTHKRRLSCLGPGGIQRETANMAIRGIHATHYGRICPIETPEGKNAGLVNSITIYANLNSNGFIETPFWKMYKGMILNTTDPLLFDSKQEGDFTIAPGDIKKTELNFLPKNALIPSRKLKQFKRVSRNNMNYIAMSPVQMISVATSLIPFLEHDDGNRALMGSNMQRQAVPTIQPAKPIVGTGLESRVISDIGHGLQAKKSGFVSYVDGNQIVIYSKQTVPPMPLKPVGFKLLTNPDQIHGSNSSLILQKQKISKKLTKFDFIQAFQSLKLSDQKTFHNSLAQKPCNVSTLGDFIDPATKSCIDSTQKFDINKVGNIYSTQKSVYQDLKKISLFRLTRKQLASLYNNLFLNDISGQLELLTFLSKKAAYSNVTNNFKPLFPKRYRTLFELSSSQTGIIKYYKTLLVKLYRIKPYLFNQKEILFQPLPTNKDIRLLQFPSNQLLNQPIDLSVYSLKLKKLLVSSSIERVHTKTQFFQSPLIAHETFRMTKKYLKQVSEPYNSLSMNWFSDYQRPYRSISSLNKPVNDLKTLDLAKPSLKLNKNHVLNSTCKLTAGIHFRTLTQIGSKVSKNTGQIASDKLNVNRNQTAQSVGTSLLAIKYSLDKFHGSNQDTYMVHRPTVKEGQWIEKGDILADNSSSQQGELAIGQNIMVGYTPWEGYNFEDAVLLSQRLTHDELYTSLHIERYEIEVRDTQFGMEQITAQLPMKSTNIDYLDDQGIVKIGTWVKAGDILVGKITPIDQKPLTPYEKLLYDILEKKVPKTRNTSLRVPKNVSGRVIHIEIIETETPNVLDKFSQANNSPSISPTNFETNDKTILDTLLKSSLPQEQFVASVNSLKRNKAVRASIFSNKCRLLNHQATSFKENDLSLDFNCFISSSMSQKNFDVSVPLDRLVTNKGGDSEPQRKKTKGKKLSQNSGPLKIHVYLAEKRMIQVGDKIAGRHGNKGIISNILPIQDMPYLPDGTPLDLVLNPLGVPSRMNVGQIFECLLGLAGSYLGQNYKIQPFDELYGCEASRSLVYSKLYEARIKTGQDWLFNPNSPGKIRLFDGRTGQCFKQPVTVGCSYILKLVHQVDEKIHARSTGPYSLVTQQPLRGRSKQGGQRVGEMEVWALEGFGAAYILQELLTIKSDAMHGREQVIHAILENKSMAIGTPESFKVLVRELQSVCLDIYSSQIIGPFSKRGIIDMVQLP